jgi:hypothetical protein
MGLMPLWDISRDWLPMLGTGDGISFRESLMAFRVPSVGWLSDCVTDVADTIRDFLHFSVPDKGPLTDYESWMPDFMKGLASGIDKSKKYVEKAVGGVAKAMQLTMDSDLNYSLHGISGAMLSGSSGGTVNNYYNTDNRKTVNQTNQSPKALSRLEIYRLTRNALNI